MNYLYNHKKVKALVSLTKGEGFGRPLLEFSLVKKPILTTNWSGHTDFLDPKFTTLVSGDIKPIDKSAIVKDILIEESKWFAPNIPETAQNWYNIFDNYKGFEKGATLQYHKSKNNFSYQKMKESLSKMLDKSTPDFPELVPLSLPKLNLPKLEKIENV